MIMVATRSSTHARASAPQEQIMGHFCRWSLAALTCLALSPLLAAQKPAYGQNSSAETFYKGRGVNMIIGYSVGGGYDLYARVLANHLGKYIPGNPTLVPQNMTGAGSAKAANYLYSVAPKDGTVIGTFSRSMAINP